MRGHSVQHQKFVAPYGHTYYTGGLTAQTLHIMLGVGVCLVLVGGWIFYKARHRLLTIDFTGGYDISGLRGLPLNGNAGILAHTKAPPQGLLTSRYGTHLGVWNRQKAVEHWTTEKWVEDEHGHRRRETENHSRTLFDTTTSHPFLLTDSTGSTSVFPDGADMDDIPMICNNVRNPEGISRHHFDSHIKYDEWMLPVGFQVLVMGACGQTPEGSRFLHKEGARDFFISTDSPEKMLKETGSSVNIGYLILGLGVLLAVMGLVL